MSDVVGKKLYNAEQPSSQGLPKGISIGGIILGLGGIVMAFVTPKTIGLGSLSQAVTVTPSEAASMGSLSGGVVTHP